VGKHAHAHDAQACDRGIARRGFGAPEVGEQAIELAYALADSSSAFFFLPNTHANTMLMM
jgi:hypothetical protein